MKILLTGVNGFIGRNLYEGLKDKYVIFAPSHKELDLLDWKKTERYIRHKKVNVIVHAAIKGGDDVLEQTLRMFLGIVRNADKVDKIIHFGSGAEYGKAKELKKIKEIEFGQSIPKDNYGLAKYSCHLIGQKNKRIVNLRLFGIYGKYEGPYYKFISNSIAKNLFDLPIRIKQNVIFDYLFVDDLVKIVEFFLVNKAGYDSYNITPSKSISLKDIVKTINNISQNKVQVSLANKGLNSQYTGSNKRLLKEFPSIKFTSYKDGIKKLLNYYQNNLSKIDKSAIIGDDYFKISKIKR